MPKKKQKASKQTVLLNILGCLVVGGMVSFVTYSFVNQPAKPKDAPVQVACQSQGAQHMVVIQDGQVTPAHTEAKLCDTLTITNNDNVGRVMAFGVHEQHQPYDGVTEQMLHQGDSFTVTLNRSGTYTFHDHLHDEVIGDFTVTK
ncbi:MAG TPA: hypothetical protein VJR27_00760 [Candidatus Saccharimonadales bacterium]|nr:hypothetical protein [Candidatus Saccharimonadales bacterium]